MAEEVVTASGPACPARRALLLRSTALLAASVTTPIWAQTEQDHANDFWRRPREVRLRHPSGEVITSTYWSDGQVVVSEYARLSWFMRDRVMGTAVYMNPVLLDILYGLCGWLSYYGIRDPIGANSFYRDPRRNPLIEGAALNSLHPKGEAGDVTIPGVNALQVAKFGAWLGGGGVGWYPTKNFTHLDRGRLRAWRG